MGERHHANGNHKKKRVTCGKPKEHGDIHKFMWFHNPMDVNCVDCLLTILEKNTHVEKTILKARIRLGEIMSALTELLEHKEYIYKDVTYIPKQIVKMKNPGTGKWVPAVAYTAKGCEEPVYVRDFVDFTTKFTGVKPEGGYL